MFRSTGSYEPDPGGYPADTGVYRFDPQALTSLTVIPKPTIIIISGFDPQALTSLTGVAFGT